MFHDRSTRYRSRIRKNVRKTLLAEVLTTIPISTSISCRALKSDKTKFKVQTCGCQYQRLPDQSKHQNTKMKMHCTTFPTADARIFKPTYPCVSKEDEKSNMHVGVLGTCLTCWLLISGPKDVYMCVAWIHVCKVQCLTSFLPLICIQMCVRRPMHVSHTGCCKIFDGFLLHQGRPETILSGRIPFEPFQGIVVVGGCVNQGLMWSKSSIAWHKELVFSSEFEFN